MRLREELPALGLVVPGACWGWVQLGEGGSQTLGLN